MKTKSTILTLIAAGAVISPASVATVAYWKFDSTKITLPQWVGLLSI